MTRATLTFLLLAVLAGAPVGLAQPDVVRKSVRFAFAPQKAYQDKYATVKLAVRPAGARCSLAVRYADGSTQKNLPVVRAVNGKARWRWQIPRSADAGPARVTGWCRKVGKISRTIVIVGATAVPVQLRIHQQGFRQRPEKSGIGSTVSYGIVLANPAQGHDVLKVSLLLNFLNADGRVIASKTERVAGVGAGSLYHLGGSIFMQNTIPITRLEVVLVDAEQKEKSLFFPAVVALGIAPGLFDVDWVGEVHGEVVNGHATMFLQRAKISVVVYNATGEILGGSSTITFAALPPGARVLFKAVSGLKPIPILEAATAVVSVEPTWAPPG